MLLWIPIDRDGNIPLIKQIYQYLREQILCGALQEGDKLPSTRELANYLGVSRNTILDAYEQLIAEGFLITQRGAGTFIAEGTFLERRNRQKMTVSKSTKLVTDVIDFRSGIPDLTLFPRKVWAKLSQETWNDAEALTFGYDQPEGRLELREVLSSYLFRTRGVSCHPEQIIITSGATQALTLLAKLLLSPDDHVVIEDPITTDIQTIFQATGASLYPIPVDEKGINTALLPKHLCPEFIFITPSHQFPLGSTLPIQRRIELIEYVRQKNSYIVEDDYDSEFRFEGLPISSLQGLEEERVVYIGSFSKILSPALRIGYVILPYHLIDHGRELKWFSDLHTPSIDQLVLARFIKNGYLERHILKMKKLYKRRRDLLMSELKKSFSEKVTFLGYSTGLHIVTEWKDIIFSEQVMKRLEESHVKIYPVEDHSINKGKHRNRMIIGYGHLRSVEITEGVQRLKSALDKEKDGKMF